MITVKVTNLDTVIANLADAGRQIPFATARAITVTAHDVNKAITAELQARIQGGATPYTLRAFKVAPATKNNLAAVIALKTPGQSAGTPYEQSIAHLFHGGVRRFKRLEGLLIARGILPDGLQIVPGPALQLDSRGNARQTDLREMLGILTAYRRNLKIFRRSGRGKTLKEIGFFIVRAGSIAARHLHPGIYRRLESGPGPSHIEPWFLFVRPGNYDQKFDLDQIAASVVQDAWPKNFAESFAKAIASAK